MSSQPQRLRGVRVLKAVSSAIRLQILSLLFDRGELSYTELMNLLKMSPSRDAGRFAYHLKFLLRTGLVEVDASSKKYKLTDLGCTVLEVAEEIERKGLKPQRILVRTSRFTLEEFDVNRIVDSLVKEAGMPVEQAKKVAKDAEKRLLKAKTKYLTAPLIREVVNGILIEKGLEEHRHKLTRLGLPVYDVTQSLREKDFGNASSVHEEFGKNVVAEYVLLNVLPRDVADAHMSGKLHIENLGDWILKPEEAIHDLRFFLEKNAVSQLFRSPPKSLYSALNLTLNILLHSAREVSGTQTLEYFNVFLAPFMKSLRPEEAKEALKLFVCSLSQHVDAALSLELTVPDFLASKPVGGDPSQGVYGDFLEECRILALLTLEVLAEESLGRPLASPKVVVKLRREVFKDEETSKILLTAHGLASERGIPYFANNIKEGEECTVFSPSAFQLKADLKGDWEIDTLRTGVLGTVTINLPRAVYESNGNENAFFEKLGGTVEMAMQAVEIKNRTLKQSAERFLRFLAQTLNGEQYFRLENSARLINLAGLEEASEAFNGGKNLYESKEASKFAAKILQYVFEVLREGRGRGRRFLSSMKPSPEASSRLARQDIERYGLAKTRFRGTRDKPYYSTFNRIEAQNLEASLKMLAVWKDFYPSLSGGKLTVVELGEAMYGAEELLALTRRLTLDYGVEFFTYNRSLAYCRRCRSNFQGVIHKCPKCSSVNSLTVFNRYP